MWSQRGKEEPRTCIAQRVGAHQGLICSSGCCKVFSYTAVVWDGVSVQTKGIQQLQKFAWSWAHLVKGQPLSPMEQVRPMVRSS